MRASIRDGEWTFPVDVPLVELEARFADRLRSEFELADVSVRLDENARATVNAAPPVGALSKRIPAGKRAVSISALLPTGLAAGDEVDVVVGDRTVSGTVLSVTGGAKAAGRETAETDGGVDTKQPTPASTSTAPGGDGRVTLAVSRRDATALLETSTAERLVSLLRRGGRRFRTLTVREGGLLDGVTLGEAAVRDSYDVSVFAVRHEGAWRIAPRGGQAVAAGDSLVVVGTREALGAFEEATA